MADRKSRVAIFSTKQYIRQFFGDYNARPEFGHEIVFFDCVLDQSTVALAAGFETVCVFVNDTVNSAVLEILARGGTRLLALRCAGFNNVDLAKADELGITILRVPAYSPYAVAEHAVALILSLNRHIHKAYNKVREGNFSLDGLLGFDLHGKTVGIIGTGQIGAITAKILKLGFNCRVLGYDVFQNKELIELGMPYVSLDEIYANADVISLHVPLLPATHHMINTEAIAKMKRGVMIINTSRGALVDTKAVIAGLKSGQVGHVGMDVYEEEGNMFFEDLSGTVLQDDVFSRLLTFPNVIITGHQAFFTWEAMDKITTTTLTNINDFKSGAIKKENQVIAPTHKAPAAAAPAAPSASAAPAPPK